jgi:hypothetical protein
LKNNIKLSQQTWVPESKVIKDKDNVFVDFEGMLIACGAGKENDTLEYPIPEPTIQFTENRCSCCGNLNAPFRCARCGSVYYCK